MLPEIGASEVLLIAIVALIVVGPKDLPMLLRRLGQFMAKLRGMAAEFRASFDEMARQSELDELRKEVEAMRKGNYIDLAAQTEHVEMQSTVADIEASLSDVGVNLHPQMSYEYAPETVAISDAAPEAATTVKPARKSRAKAAEVPKPIKAPRNPAAKPKAPLKATAAPRRRKSAAEGEA